MRPPYPVALPPQLSAFLQRRRAKSDFPLRAMERYGLDRPAYFSMIDLGIQDPRGARLQDIGNASYRTTDGGLRGAFAAAQSVGLVSWSDDRVTLTPAGVTALADLRQAMAAYFAGLAPIGAAELERLAGLLDDALAACVASPEPKTREHTPRAARYRWQDPSSPFARLDAAIYGLWMVRDDSHVQAWRDAGLRGPAIDVLTHAWRKEAATEDELATKISTQRPDDVRAAVRELRGTGLLTAGPELALTPAGTETRERIEAATDRYFFGPWPEAVGAQAGWIVDRLTAVNTALA
jgi:hypothetical protein